MHSYIPRIICFAPLQSWPSPLHCCYAASLARSLPNKQQGTHGTSAHSLFRYSKRGKRKHKLTSLHSFRKRKLFIHIPCRRSTTKLNVHDIEASFLDVGIIHVKLNIWELWGLAHARFCLPTRIHRAPQLCDVALNYWKSPSVALLSEPWYSKARNMLAWKNLLYFPQYQCANCPKCQFQLFFPHLCACFSNRYRVNGMFHD